MNLKVDLFCLICGLVYQCHQVMCREISRCYDDVDVCLWTDGSQLTQQQAEAVCRQRNGSSLVRTSTDNADVLPKLSLFRRDARTYELLADRTCWIDVKSVNRSVSGKGFHWIDGSALANADTVHTTSVGYYDFAVITYDDIVREFVYSVQRWKNYYNDVTSYICQQQQGSRRGCAADELAMSSKCYRMFDRRVTWYEASNKCVSRGGSLAVFTGRPSLTSLTRQLTDWLNVNHTYWVGLKRSWWQTTDEDGRKVDIQYSNWPRNHPTYTDGCVAVTQHNNWITTDCDQNRTFVCQSPASQSTAAETTTHNARDVQQDNTIIIIAIAVAVPSLVVIVVIIAVLVYCYKVKKNRNAADKPPPSTDDYATAHDYATLDHDTPAQQPQYDVIQLDTARHQAPPATAADD